MKHATSSFLRAALAAAVVFAAIAAPASRPATAGARTVEGTAAFELPTDQLIIKYKATADIAGANAPDGSARLQALSEVAGVQLAYFRPMSGDAHVLRLPDRMPVPEVALIARKLMALADVEYAEPDLIMQHTGVPAGLELAPNDTLYVQQWHYFDTYGINAPAAWNITTGSASTVVAVIDTGYTDHPDLAGRFVGGYDFISNSAIANDGNLRDADAHDPGDWITDAENDVPPFIGCAVSDSSWHGTHVAGTIGANSNNASGVAGINWAAKILPVRVLGKCGGFTSDIVDGMRWAAGLSVSGVPANANPAKVLNISLGGPGPCDPVQQSAIDDIVNIKNAIVVVAAGNSGLNVSGFNPANCNRVITVAATDRGGDRASYSNFGSLVEISAPGGETSVSSNGVLSTLNSGATVPASPNYVFYQGTSMAAPHVAGVVSLMAGLNSTLSHTSTLSILQNTARPFPGGSGCSTSNCGSGIIDAAAALMGINFVPDEFVYLPAILRNYPPPPPGGNPIVNGTFEAGPTGWAQSSTGGFTLITNDFESTGVTAHGGTWGVWLGGANNETAYIQQNVTIPSGSSILSFWHWAASAETICGFDFAYVRINGANVDSFSLCDTNDTGGWVRRTVNLSAYVGQNVQLQFRATTDSSFNSNWFLDDVALGASLLFEAEREPMRHSATSPEAPHE